jgi:DNA-directed RNA polymerase subunit M/transcription elongation factor TFIIS
MIINSQCSECGRQLPKKHTRCLFCDDLKYQTELANGPIAKLEKDGITQRLKEVRDNSRNKKIALEQARLDSALAWGTAISSIETGKEEVTIETSRKSINYCSNCGQKLNSNDVYCSKCGNSLEGVSLNSQARSPIKHKKKSRKLVLAITVTFFLLAILMIIGSQNLINPNPSGDSKTPPVTLEPTPSPYRTSKCETTSVPNPNAPTRLKDLIESGIPLTIKVETCTDVYVQP